MTWDGLMFAACIVGFVYVMVKLFSSDERD